MKIMYDDELYQDYDHLGANWLTDLVSSAGKTISSIFGTAVEATKPVLPALIYRQATGQELPPTTVTVQAPAQSGTPAWVMPAVVGVSALGLIMILKSQSQRRSYR